jgi:hypothetical protein
MKFHIRSAMPWYLALWQARGSVRGEDAKNFFWKLICEFRSQSVLSERAWPDSLWYLKAFEFEKRRWERSRGA